MDKPIWCVPQRLYYMFGLPVVYELAYPEGARRKMVTAYVLKDETTSQYVLIGRCKDKRVRHSGFDTAEAARAYGNRNLLCMKEKIDGRQETSGTRSSEEGQEEARQAGQGGDRRA
jgi:hypothetical protein